MARRRNPPETIRVKWQLAERLRSIRIERFGEHRLAEFARLVGVPVRTWYSYETGVTVPAEVLLHFVALTKVEPTWLLHGRGSKYQEPSEPESAATGVPQPQESGQAISPHATGRAVGGPVGTVMAAVPRTNANGKASSNGHPRGFNGHSRGSWPASQTLGAGPDSGPAVGRTTVGPRLAVAGAEDGPSTPYASVRADEDAMHPIIAPGAFVAYADIPEDLNRLDGKLVVVRMGRRTLIRWMHLSGAYGVLRAHNPDFEPATELLDLQREAPLAVIRRVLWVGTRH